MSINPFTKIITQEKIAKEFGFYWENLDQLIEQIKSECDEIKEAWQNKEAVHLKEEVGDVINAVISLSIFCGLDPEQTLSESTEKFQKRYEAVVRLANQAGYTTLREQPLEVLMHFWNKAKQEVG